MPQARMRACPEGAVPLAQLKIDFEGVSLGKPQAVDRPNYF